MIRLQDFEGPAEFLESMRDADIVRKHKNLVYVQALKFLQTSGGRGGRSLAARTATASEGHVAARASQREQELMHAQGAGRHAEENVSSRATDHRRRDPREVPRAGDPRAQRPGPRPLRVRRLPARQRDAGAGLGPPPGRHLHAQARGDPGRDRGGRRLLRPRRQRADEELQAALDRPDRRLRDALREVPADRPRPRPPRTASSGSPRRSRSSSRGSSWSWARRRWRP